MKTMKLIKLIAIAMMMVTTFTACKKDKDTTPKVVSIEVKWVGTHKFGNSADQDIFFTIEPQKVIKWYNSASADAQVNTSGTYTLSDSAFSTDQVLNGITLVYTATFNNTTGMLTDGKITIKDGAEIGTWKATKQ